MKIFMSFLSSFFLFTCAASANAIIINDVVTFNKFMVEGDSVSWVHDLNQYGYGPDDYNSPFTVIFEIRDYDDAPWKGEGPPDRPELMISQGGGRTYSWVHSSGFTYEESNLLHIESAGVVRPHLTLLSGRAWLSSITLTMDIKSPVGVPEPESLALLLFGLLGLGLRRYRS